MRVIAYVRVSTEEQADSRAGLDAQRAAIQSAAAEHGWEVVSVIEDAGCSAKTTRRPGLQKALEALSAGQADVLVVSKLDRLSRSLLDFAAIMDLAQRQGWACIALDTPADPTTPMGEAMVSIMATFAQLERRLIGQRTRDGLAAKRAEGVRLGRPSKIPNGTRDRITADRAAGLSLRAIADALNADGIDTGQGGKCWYASSVRAVLLAD